MFHARLHWAQASTSYQPPPSTQEWLALQYACTSAEAKTRELNERRCCFESAVSVDRLLWENVNERLSDAPPPCCIRLSNLSNLSDIVQAAQVQSKEIEISLLSQRLQSTRKRIRLLHIRLVATSEAEEADGKAVGVVRDAVSSDAAKLECGSVEVELLRQASHRFHSNIFNWRHSLSVLREESVLVWNELIMRRLYMLGELRALLLLHHQKPVINSIIRRFTQDHDHKAIIDGHFVNHRNWSLIEPSRRLVSSTQPGEDASESEICASAGYLVNFLDCGSQIFDLPLKHFVRFRGSQSTLVSRLTNERFNLFGGAKRVHNNGKKGTERLRLAFTMLSENFDELFRALQSLPPYWFHQLR